jgi:GxxExxY protein
MGDIDAITETIIGEAIEVHRELGPGLLESVYEVCLATLLARRGMRVRRQCPMPVMFQGVRIATGFRVDLFIEDRVVVELKTGPPQPVHISQMLTYLKLSGCTVGLLINFNVPRLVDGVKRVVRDHPDAPKRPVRETPRTTTDEGDE